MENSSKTNTSLLPEDNEIIWFPEWKHFKIVKLNNVYQLFDARQLVFHSSSLETVKAELIERFYFFEIESPKNQN